MGEMADYFVNRMIWGPYGKSKFKRRTYQTGSGNYMWRTKDKGVISMYDMDVDHLINAINICKMKDNWGKQEQLEYVLNKKLEAEEKSKREEINNGNS